jgi:hypothetical protein
MTQDVKLPGTRPGPLRLLVRDALRMAVEAAFPTLECLPFGIYLYVVPARPIRHPGFSYNDTHDAYLQIRLHDIIYCAEMLPYYPNTGRADGDQVYASSLELRLDYIAPDLLPQLCDFVHRCTQRRHLLEKPHEEKDGTS